MEAVSEPKVRRYFDGEAERFDAIYAQEKNLGQKMIDQLFRRVILQRFRLTLDLCGPLNGKRVLDIGCGSGRYGIEMAQRGATVVGLDFAPAMVQMARRAAEAAGVEHLCSFYDGDFLSWEAPHSFDICLGIGFFDYIAEPDVFLRKIRSLTIEKAVFSFPVRWTIRTLTRRVRLSINQCPVYFYDSDQVHRLMQASDWEMESIDLHRLSRDYLVDAKVKRPQISKATSKTRR